jgi:septum formation protein
MLTSRKLILASSSPRRQELLRKEGIEFEVSPANIPEEQRPGEPPIDYALRLAQEKALKIAEKFPDKYVLGADTIVVVDGEILGKPASPQDAARMLALLSGRTHQVITAVSMVAPIKRIDTRSLTSNVHFRALTPQEIEQYIAGGEPMDKAGAYAIQGGAASWVTRLEGDYSNVVGLPLPLVKEMLRDSGFLQS